MRVTRYIPEHLFDERVDLDALCLETKPSRSPTRTQHTVAFTKLMLHERVLVQAAKLVVRIVPTFRLVDLFGVQTECFAHRR